MSARYLSYLLKDLHVLELGLRTQQNATDHVMFSFLLLCSWPWHLTLTFHAVSSLFTLRNMSSCHVSTTFLFTSEDHNFLLKYLMTATARKRMDCLDCTLGFLLTLFLILLRSVSSYYVNTVFMFTLEDGNSHWQSPDCLPLNLCDWFVDLQVVRRVSWHWMPLLRPGVIKQYSTQLLWKMTSGCCVCLLPSFHCINHNLPRTLLDSFLVKEVKKI